MVPEGAQRYCAPVASTHPRRRAVGRRRFAVAAVGHIFTVPRCRFGQVAVSRPFARSVAEIDRSCACALCRFHCEPFIPRSTVPNPHSFSRTRSQTAARIQTWAVRCEIDGPQTSTSFESFDFPICLSYKLKWLRYFENS